MYHVPSHPLLDCVYNPSYTHQGYKALYTITTYGQADVVDMHIVHTPFPKQFDLDTGYVHFRLIEITTYRHPQELQYRLGVYVGTTELKNRANKNMELKYQLVEAVRINYCDVCMYLIR